MTFRYKIWNKFSKKIIMLYRKTDVFMAQFLYFYAFQSISSRLRHTFFSKIFVSEKRKTRVSEANKMRACWSDWLYQSFIKDHSQLSYCSLEIVYAVKDCDLGGALLSSKSFCDSRSDYLSLLGSSALSSALSVCLSFLLLKPISR